MTARFAVPPAGSGPKPPDALVGQGSGLDTAGPASVLVVEDDWLIALDVEAALTDAGFAVVGTAVSADEAVALAVTHQPDIVLMDIRLEGVRDGIEAAAEIYERLGTRCLYISANADPATRKRASDTRPLGWLPKPFSARQLVDAVKTALVR